MYRVQYYSQFAGKWKDYVSITHNATPVTHKTVELAMESKRRLERDHPADEFRIREL